MFFLWIMAATIFCGCSTDSEENRPDDELLAGTEWICGESKIYPVSSISGGIWNDVLEFIKTNFPDAVVYSYG